MTDGLAVVSAELTQLDFYIWCCMKNVVYECNVNREEPLHQIFVAARLMNDPDVLCKVMYSMIRFVRCA
jgi:hypothetical protein